MANAWFESVAEAQRRAKKRLPKGVYGALVAGSERGLSADDNLAAFAELGVAPHTAGLSNERRLGVTVMGQQVSMPCGGSPFGVVGASSPQTQSTGRPDFPAHLRPQSSRTRW